MNVITRNIPNFITCLNVASGFTAIVLASRGGDTVAGLPACQWAYIFIAIAAVADFLDGFAARLLHAYSNLGKELDSLCDLVSFGVAPAVLLVNCLVSADAPEWLRWLPVLIPVAGALRLAKFNIDTRQTTSFIGLPIPANAIFWIGFTALVSRGASFLTQWPVCLAVILFECWLMVSPLRLFSLKFSSWGWKGNVKRWLLVISAVALVAIMGVPGLFWLIVVYVLMSLVGGGSKI